MASVGTSAAHRPWTIQYGEQSRQAGPPRWLRHWRGDGIIARVVTTRIADAVRAAGVPAVDLGGLGLLPSIPGVGTDHALIGRLAAEHLLERGFKHFGYRGMGGVSWSEARGRWFQEALAERGHACSILAPPVGPGTFDPWKKRHEEVGRWVRALPLPAAVLAAWDGCGVELARGLSAIGDRRPG